jgi:hypothetical protein
MLVVIVQVQPLNMLLLVVEDLAVLATTIQTLIRVALVVLEAILIIQKFLLLGLQPQVQVLAVTLQVVVAEEFMLLAQAVQVVLVVEVLEEVLILLMEQAELQVLVLEAAAVVQAAVMVDQV